MVNTKGWKRDVWCFLQGGIEVGEKERDAIIDTKSKEYYALQNKQGSFKAIINSVYGIMGYSNFRLYDTRIPESITYMGRQLLIQLKYNLFHY